MELKLTEDFSEDDNIKVVNQAIHIDANNIVAAIDKYKVSPARFLGDDCFWPILQMQKQKLKLPRRGEFFISSLGF
jgi:hypothetical protein